MNGIQKDKDLTRKNSDKLEKKGPGSSSNTKRNLSNKGDKEDEVIQGSADKNAVTTKKKQLKGPKITGITTDEYSATTDTQSMATQGLSVVTKLKSWDEFFDPEELQTGIACMK